MKSNQETRDALKAMRAALDEFARRQEELRGLLDALGGLNKEYRELLDALGVLIEDRRDWQVPARHTVQ